MMANNSEVDFSVRLVRSVRSGCFLKFASKFGVEKLISIYTLASAGVNL